jgi:hypothetical protein
MAKRWFIFVALVSLLTGADIATAPVGAASAAINRCGDPGLCAMPYQWCGMTSELICGYGIECCSGFCESPDTSGDCNNDSAQCICVDIGSPKS